MKWDGMGRWWRWVNSTHEARKSCVSWRGRKKKGDHDGYLRRLLR